MIIIKLPIKIKYISQIQYNKIISSLNFNNLQCPNCHSKNIDYATRIIGYLKRVSNFSAPRQEEASRRYYATNQ